ncbi:MAG: hypothetical protein ACI8WB_003912 [Phenylobacterium sp.]|jgi:hypothetical protein
MHFGHVRTPQHTSVGGFNIVIKPIGSSMPKVRIKPPTAEAIQWRALGSMLLVLKPAFIKGEDDFSSWANTMNFTTVDSADGRFYHINVRHNGMGEKTGDMVFAGWHFGHG